ncbi:MAG: AMP-binding protein [Thermodesulfobacteriota bacterium]|nr:AMP-binding protein [Thermodesulfobacteriota bacterium]
MKTCYVETWLHEKVRQTTTDNPELGGRECFKDLSHITRSHIEEFQFFKLKRILDYAFQKSRYYKEVFAETGITPNDIRNMNDFVKLPLTEPDDLAQIPHKFVCVSLKEFAQEYLFDTSGTEGKPKRVVCTQHDIDKMIDFMSAGMRTVSERNDTILLILPGGRPNSQSDLLSKGVSKMGGIPVICDINVSPEECIQMIEQHRPKVIFTSPSRIHRITMGYTQKSRLQNLGVQTLFLTSEHVSSAMRKKLQDIWNCEIHGHYGMTEMGLGVSVECHAHDGYHFNEADLLLETIDPSTGELIEGDSEGELVFTTLTREGTPLIRYRTHDITRVLKKPCPCGAVTLKRIGAPVTKKRSFVTLGNKDIIHPSFFDDEIYCVPEVVDYQVVMSKKENMDRITFRVETAEEDLGIEKEITKRVLKNHLLQKNIDQGMLSWPEIDLVSMGTLRSKSRAKKLIIDNRKGEERSKN